MAIRTKLLNWNNITRDTDFSKFIQTVSEPWVIEGFTVTANSVAVWQARVPCERTNGETLYALIYNTAPVSISGNGEVYILVNQTYIDDGELANEDWTGIATIVVGTTPSKNALKLATITGGVVTDNRHIIPKVWELETYIQSLNTRMNTAEQKIDEIIEDSAVDHLEEAGLVWELYNLSDTLFKQKTPTFANCTVDANVGDVAGNTQIHIQRIASGTASNKLKLKAKKIWAPTTWLVIEIRRGVEVDVSDSEAYWYGNELVCSGSIPYSSFSTDYQEFEITMNGQFGWTKGELLDIVVYQTSNIVNSTNYYAVACDSSQYSEGFSYVAVNGSTRTRSKLCPYCIGDGFAQSLLCKVATSFISSTTLGTKTVSLRCNSSWASDSYSYTANAVYSTVYIVVNFSAGADYRFSCRASFSITKNGSVLRSESWSDPDWTNGISRAFTLTDSLKAWDVIALSVSLNNTRGDRYSSFNWTMQIIWSNDVNNPRVLIPYELKSLGEQTTAISYGRLPDWTWYWDFNDTLSTTATTWNISLWNAVWFLTITDKNWTRYKVPVFWT